MEVNRPFVEREVDFENLESSFGKSLILRERDTDRDNHEQS
jgi:hypothetical protein